MSGAAVDPEFEAFRALTGKVAHDLGNSLQIILGHASLLESKLAGTPEGEDIAAVNAAASDAIRLTHKLMDLGFDRE